MFERTIDIPTRDGATTTFIALLLTRCFVGVGES